MNRSTRRLLLLGVTLTGALIVVATAAGTAQVGPIVFWAVHHTADADGSTVALRPGLGLLALWVLVAAVAAVQHRRHGS